MKGERENAGERESDKVFLSSPIAKKAPEGDGLIPGEEIQSAVVQDECSKSQKFRLLPVVAQLSSGRAGLEPSYHSIDNTCQGIMFQTG